MKKEKKGTTKKSILGMFGVTDKPTAKAKSMSSTSPNSDNVKLVKSHASAHPSRMQGDGIYKAFSFNNSAQPQLEIRLRGGNGLFLPYHLISSSEYQGNESLTLISQGTAYIIKGRNMRPLLDHYRHTNIEYIQEFDPAQFNQLPAEDDVLITEIEVFEIGG